MMPGTPSYSRFANMIYLAEALMLQICSVYLIARLHTSSVTTGVMLFTAGFLMEFLEFLQPGEIMRWIPFWTTSIGRGVVLAFLSAVGAMGNGFIGLISFLLAVSMMVWRLLGGNYLAPYPIMGPEETAILVEERERLSEERKEAPRRMAQPPAGSR